MIKDLIVIIPARGNSKGIKRKNLKIFNKKRIIDYSINFSKKIGAEKIIVSSEYKKIINYCKKFNILVDKRDKKLSNDNVHASKVVLSIVKKYKIKNHKYICLFLPTYPLRELKKFKKFIKNFLKSKFYSLIGIVDTGFYTNNLRFIKKSLLTAKNLSLTQRQYAEKVYAVNGSIFLTKVSNIKKFKTFHSKKKSKYIICDTKFSIDLNNLDDVKRLEIFFKNNKKFNF